MHTRNALRQCKVRSSPPLRSTRGANATLVVQGGLPSG
jgi:hypothetical protein